MAIVSFDFINEDKGLVTRIDYVSSIIGENEVMVPEIPIAENLFGKSSMLYINPKDGQLWYEYEDRPLTTDEELENLKTKYELVQTALDDLLLGGMM